MAVLKPHDTSGAVAFNFEDMVRKAEGYFEQMRGQAGKMLAEVKKEADEIKRRAQEQGRQEGMRDAERRIQQAAEQRVTKAVTDLQAALRQAVATLESDRQSWIAAWESQAVRLAAAIAERVIRQELDREPEITLRLIRESLEMAAGAGRVSLHVSPQDRQTLGERLDRLVQDLRRLAEAEIVADPEVAPGGCRVVTEFGEIDQRLQTQLARIVEELS
jgi:flagellar assembly protein FliH